MAFSLSVLCLTFRSSSTLLWVSVWFFGYRLGAWGPEGLGSSRNQPGWEFISPWMVPGREKSLCCWDGVPNCFQGEDSPAPCRPVWALDLSKHRACQAFVRQRALLWLPYILSANVNSILCSGFVLLLGTDMNFQNMGWSLRYQSSYLTK